MPEWHRPRERNYDTEIPNQNAKMKRKHAALCSLKHWGKLNSSGSTCWAPLN